MSRPVTLSIMTGLSIVGAALGVHLGRSAIGEINPAYFSDPEVPFHADMVPYRSPDWAQVQVTEYHQAATMDGLGSGCVGCRDYPEEYIPQPDPAVDGYEDGWSASAPEPVHAVLADGPAEPDPELARVERYSSYPVSADEQQAPESEEPSGEVFASTE